MIVVCKNHYGKCVLVTRRNNKRTVAISVVGTIRKLQIIQNVDFDKEFKVTGYSPIKAIELWAESHIKMTKTVIEELQMVVAILRNKLVAKADTVEELGELKPKTTIIDGIESLEGLSMKDLVKLYNTNTAKGDRVTVIPDVEGDINAAADAVLAKLDSLDVYAPAKKESKPRVEKTYSFVKGIGEEDKLPAQAVCIVNALEEEGTLTKTQLTAALDGVVQTKQPVERIVAFYQKRLVDAGYIAMA